MFSFASSNASFQIYAIEDGEARSMWDKIGGRVSILSPESYPHIDWSMYVLSFGVLVDLN